MPMHPNIVYGLVNISAMQVNITKGAFHCKQTSGCAIIFRHFYGIGNVMNTEIIKINEHNAIEAATRAAEILKGGGIAAFPTDTVYGLGAIYSDAQAVRKVFAAKGRPENKPLSLLVSSAEQVTRIAQNIPDCAYKLMDSFWPGALTLIFKKKEDAYIPEEVTAGADTIGFRMPDLELTRQIISMADSPLAAPSANISGKRSASDASEAIEDLNGRVDMIIDGGACRVGVSSTVLDMSGEEYKILREGTVTKAMIEQIIGEAVRG